MLYTFVFLVVFLSFYLFKSSNFFFFFSSSYFLFKPSNYISSIMLINTTVKGVLEKSSGAEGEF